ncbi:MAG: carboxypeptidase-like regulatory domain-containing protein, partial [Acidobacteriota bacterium]|nr:carboxypeptidase-like regulatory domain-containing protein [Acidobacteriota bacterium]
MLRKLSLSGTAIAVLALLCLTVFGQVTAPLSGTVTDPNGAVISGATIIVKSAATGAEFRATSSGSGTYTVPSLGTGTYNVTVNAPGFKQAVIREVKMDAGIPANVNVTLEVGAATESVVIQGGAEMLQSQSANISTTLNVKQIINLPLVSRNALNFIVFLPGVDSPGITRDATINGLPENAINITLDGINVQDNNNKTTDGFFARIAPRLDAIEEVTVSTATPGADNGGGGAAQIKFITRQGTNELHGSLYEYHRNPSLNSNYWFSNRNSAPYDVKAAKTCGNPNATTFNSATQVAYDPDRCKAQRARILTNQYGFRVGGPIWVPKIFDGRNKAFFFVNYEEFRLPNASNEQRTILNARTQAGFFRYTVSGQTREVNLLEIATRNSQTATLDPTITKLLADIRGTTSKGNVTPLTDPNLEQFNFITPGNNITYFPTVRFDVNMTQKHHLELTWNYQKLNSTPDFLNNRDEAFPGFPNRGSQIGDRYTGSLAVRSTLTPTVVNEARTGLSGGPSRFNPEASALTFSDALANQGGYNLAISLAGISNATSTPNASRRNPLLRDFSDTLTWTRGSHNLSFGGQFTQLNLTLHSRPLLAPGITFGVNANDPAASMFNAANSAANFPGSSDADRVRAQNIYAVLTGRVTAITASALLSEETGKYEYLGESINRGRQREYSIFGQDAWRARPNLTLNFGLRWVVQGPYTALNDGYTTVSVDDLFGVSGPGNLFKPGTLTGRVPQFVPFGKGAQSYSTDYSNFAPNFGFAWTPSVKDGWLKRFIGDGGQTVVRAGFSVAYNRNGLADFTSVYGLNPGSAINADRSLAIGNLAAITELPVLLRDRNRLGRPSFADTPVYPLTEVITGDANIFDPNIKVPYSQSWSFGIQREITKNMAVEVRYVGTRNLQGWTDYDLNDVQQNIVENGVLSEFKLAQANLQANNAAPAASGRNGSFGYFGAGTGTSPLPVTLAYFTGQPASAAGTVASYSNASNSLFRNATFVNPLAMFNPAPLTYAANLHSDANRRTNARNAGLPANLFLTNPDLRGGVFFTGNGGYTRYDALQVEFRRRLAKGFLVQANYNFAKGFSSTRFGSFRAPRTNTLNDGVPGYVQNTFKVNWLYELPIGRGKALLGNIGNVLDRFVGGWEFHGTGRVQSGQILNFGNVRLVGMTEKEFRKEYGLYFDDGAKLIYNLPKDIIENTIKAFTVSATTRSGYPEPGGVPSVPTGRYIAPANSPSCIQVVTGDCAPQTLYVT